MRACSWQSTRAFARKRPKQVDLWPLDQVAGSTRGAPAVRRPWVAKLTGLDDAYGFDREFVEAKVDYIDANAKGTRGVKLWYLLEAGTPHEVCEWVSKNRKRRYFVKTDDSGNVVECSREEVEAWLMR